MGPSIQPARPIRRPKAPGWAALAALALFAGAAVAEPDAYSPPTPSLLHAAGAAPHLSDGLEVEPGRWTLDWTVGYVNVWNYSWHPGTVHRRLDRLGQPFLPDLVDEIADRFPESNAHQIDLDAWRTDLRLARGFARGGAVSVRIPWIQIGEPSGDRVAESFHEAFGFKEQRRDYFPRNQSTVYAQGESGILYAGDGLDGASVGDVAVTISGPLGEAGGGRHRGAITVEAPTGDDDTLRGSGGWDVGVHWTGAWRPGRTALRVQAGYTRLDRSGSWLGVERDDTWHLAVEASRPLGTRWAGYVAARIDTSPIDGYAGLSEPLEAAHLGFVRRFAGNWRGVVSATQDLGGPTADFGLHVSVATTWSGRGSSR